MSEPAEEKVTQLDTRRLTRAAKAVLFSPAVILAATAVRLLIVANYNVPIAISVATSGGVVNALLGTTTMLIATFLPLIGLVLIMFRKLRLALLALTGAAFVSPAYGGVLDSVRTIWPRTKAWAGLIARHHYLLFWTDERECIVLIAVAVFFTWWDVRVRRNENYKNLNLATRYNEEQKQDYAIATLGWMAGYSIVIIIVTYLAFSVISSVFRIPADSSEYSNALEEVWIPAETLTVTPGSPIVGYVLSTGDGWFVVLVNDTRTIEYIPANKISARSICELPQYSQKGPKPLINLATAQPVQVPLCPSAPRPSANDQPSGPAQRASPGHASPA
jgi:hypothetical protein